MGFADAQYAEDEHEQHQARTQASKPTHALFFTPSECEFAAASVDRRCAARLNFPAGQCALSGRSQALGDVPGQVIERLVQVGGQAHTLPVQDQFFLIRVIQIHDETPLGLKDLLSA